jgi:hypothetical protein
MELSTIREDTSCSSAEELLSILWNPEVLYHIHKSHLLSLNQTNPLHTTHSYLSKIHFNIIRSSTAWSSVVSFLVAFPPIS